MENYRASRARLLGLALLLELGKVRAGRYRRDFTDEGTKRCKSVKHVCGLFGSTSRPLANISKSGNFSNVHWVVHNFEVVAKISGLSKGRS